MAPLNFKQMLNFILAPLKFLSQSNWTEHFLTLLLIKITDEFFKILLTSLLSMKDACTKMSRAIVSTYFETKAQRKS